jgi:LmbE family N-acetylglucosaminyl deacetylase
MNKRRLLKALFLCGLFVGGWSGSSAADEAAPVAEAGPSFPEMRLSDDDRVLVCAPHPDDEVLGCAGIIQEAVARHIPVKVLFFTYGDFNEWSFLIYRRHPVFWKGSIRRMGQVRHDEAIEACKVLGVSSDDVVFLGYPDFGTLDIWYHHWDKRPAFSNFMTGAKAVPYKNALRPGAPYKGEDILQDLRSVLKDFKPTRIFISHPADHNMDHRALYLFANVALWDLGMDAVALEPYIVHYRAWPMPRGSHPEKPLTPPDLFKTEIPWKVFPLSPERVEEEQGALQKHRSQLISSRSYLESFVRKNELFGDFVHIVLKEAGSPVGFSSQVIEPAPADGEEAILESEKAAFIGSEGHVVSWENDALVFVLDVSRPLAKQIGISLYFFGYRRDVPFEKMPKINIRVGAWFRAVYDQKTRMSLKRKGVQIIRTGKSVTVRIPLKLLGNPEKILASAGTYLGGLTLDWVSWKILRLER